MTENPYQAPAAQSSVENPRRKVTSGVPFAIAAVVFFMIAAIAAWRVPRLPVSETPPVVVVYEGLFWTAIAAGSAVASTLCGIVALARAIVTLIRHGLLAPRS